MKYMLRSVNWAYALKLLIAGIATISVTAMPFVFLYLWFTCQI